MDRDHPYQADIVTDNTFSPVNRALRKPVVDVPKPSS